MGSAAHQRSQPVWTCTSLRSEPTDPQRVPPHEHSECQYTLCIWVLDLPIRQTTDSLVYSCSCCTTTPSIIIVKISNKDQTHIMTQQSNRVAHWVATTYIKNKELIMDSRKKEDRTSCSLLSRSYGKHSDWTCYKTAWDVNDRGQDSEHHQHSSTDDQVRSLQSHPTTACSTTLHSINISHKSHIEVFRRKCCDDDQEAWKVPTNQ